MGFLEQKICVSDEDSFNDQGDTSIDYMIPVQSFDPTFQSDRSTDRALHPRLFHTRPGYKMPRSGGSITLEAFLAGAQRETATGAQVHTWQTKMLSHGMGGEDLTQVGGVAGASATATSLPSRTGTGLRGGIIAVGEAGDGRAEGQAAVQGDPTTALLTGLPAAPGAADVVRAALMLYFKQTLGVSKRFLLEHTGDDDLPEMQRIFTGCQLAALGIRMSHTEPPILSMTYNYAFWREVDTGAFISTPDENSLQQCDTASSTGGSYFLGPVGTAARPDNAEEEATELELTISIGLVALEGQFPGLPGCNIRGWKRTKPAGEPAARLRVTHPVDESMLASWDKDGSQSDHFQFLATLSPATPDAPGRQTVLFAPDMYRIEQRMPPVNWNTRTYMTSVFGLCEGPDRTNQLTRSFLRIGVL